MEDIQTEQIELIDGTPSMENSIKKEKKSNGDRTIETMFRTTISSHIKLSDMADQKAGLLLSVNAIIISIMTGLMITEIKTNPLLIIPTSLLIMVCLMSITYSLIATRPNIRERSLKDINDEELVKLDLLFFADYTALSFDQYKETLSTRIVNSSDIKDMLIKNIYNQGVAIKRKYKYIKIAYSIFMYGLPLAMISYLITIYLEN